MLKTLFAAGLLAVCAFGLPAVAQPVDDGDEDGVLDFFDNCLLVPNVAQSDTDRDGFGNLCDPDFDNDGIVDESDEAFLIDQIAAAARPAESSAEFRLRQLVDLNGDGKVDEEDLAILRSRLLFPPGPVQDTDDDGVGDGRDPCLETRAGSATVYRGCSALDLVQRPGAALDRPERLVRDTIVSVSADAGMADVRASLEAADAALSLSRRSGRKGDPCAARDAAGVALGHVLEAEKLFQEHRVRAWEDMPPAKDEGDVTQDELSLTPLASTASALSAAVAGVIASRDGFATVCEMATPFEMIDKVFSVRDGERRVEMGDLTLAIADELDLTGELTEGISGSVEGLGFADGTGVITAARFEELGDLIFAHSCLRFRFVPVQRMAPVFSGPYLLHDPEAYRLEKRYMFETKMRFAAENVCEQAENKAGPYQTQSLEDPFSRHSLTILLDYTTREGLEREDIPLAFDLEPGDTPLALFREIDPEHPVTVTVRKRIQDCRHDGDLAPIGSKASLVCDTPRFLATEVYELAMREAGGRCQASYERVEFSVDDQVSSAFSSTWVDYAIPVAVWDAGTEPVFTAEGQAMCTVNNRLVPCAPDTIHRNREFAIMNQDYYPIHDNGEFEWLEDLTGVSWASGLRWPKIRGINNGLEWQFSCTLPRIVRDVVNFCPSGTDAYYRLPFAWGDNAWTQSQGNMTPDPEKTHSGIYAYDMNAPCGRTIRAARAGVVESVTESNSRQQWPECIDTADCADHTCCPAGQMCGANSVVIRHQDNTLARYVHSPEDGIVPEVNEIVRRGQVLGLVGTTGNSSDPHLHFEVAVRDENGAFDTRLALFEAIHSEDHTTITCYEPPGWPDPDSHHYNLRSNNRVWP